MDKKALFVVFALLVFSCDQKKPDEFTEVEPTVVASADSHPIAAALRADGWQLGQVSESSWGGQKASHIVQIGVVLPKALRDLSNVAAATQNGQLYSIAVSSKSPVMFDPIESLRVAKLITDDPMSLQLHEAKPEDQSSAVETVYEEAKAKLQLPDIPSPSGSPYSLAWGVNDTSRYSITSQTLNFPFIPVTEDGLEKRTQTRAKIIAERDSKEVSFSLKNVYLRSSNDEEFKQMPAGGVAKHKLQYQLDRIGTGLVEAFPLVDSKIALGETYKYDTRVELSLKGERGMIKGVASFTIAAKETCTKSKNECVVIRHEFTMDDMSDHPHPVKTTKVFGHGVYRFDVKKGRFESGKDVVYYRMNIQDRPMLDSTNGYILMENSYELD